MSRAGHLPPFGASIRDEERPRGAPGALHALRRAQPGLPQRFGPQGRAREVRSLKHEKVWKNHGKMDEHRRKTAET